jgi:hypothetical protein
VALAGPGGFTTGAHALFAVDNGSRSALYYFTAADAAVEANELVSLATLSSTATIMA